MHSTTQPPAVDCGLSPAGNRSSADFPSHLTLQELIEIQAERDPGRLAVLCDHDRRWGTARLTYGQFNEKVNRLAHRLRQERVAPGQIVGIMVERSFAMLIGIFAIVKAGGAYLPLSVETPPARLNHILAEAGVAHLLVQSATQAKAPQGLASLNLDAEDSYSGPSENPPVANRPEDLIYVLYTSGSTGKPKGVMIEHRSVVNRLDWMQKTYPIGPGDVLLQKTSYCFDVSVWELFWWALTGAALCLLMPGGERSPLALIETIRKHRVSVVHFVPSMLHVFLEYLEAKPAVGGLASLRHVFASGEALSPCQVRNFNRLIGRRHGTRLTNLYGPTEATVDVTYFDCPAEGDPHLIPIGRPIQNTRAYILRDGQETSAGETGELCIAGVGLARGYLHNPQLTAERFVEHPTVPGERIYRTGDIARWLPDGNLEYLGREDQQVKLRGMRVELGEIEKTILTFPGVAECAVILKKYSDSVVLIVAYLVCREEVDTAALRKHLQGFLPDYMVPSHFERIDRLPLGEYGKLDRTALPEPSHLARTI